MLPIGGAWRTSVVVVVVLTLEMRTMSNEAVDGVDEGDVKERLERCVEATAVMAALAHERMEVEEGEIQTV